MNKYDIDITLDNSVRILNLLIIVKIYAFTGLKMLKTLTDNLKLEVLMSFDAVLCHLHGVTFKNISNTLKTIYESMQYALSHRDDFRPCSRVSSCDNNTINTSLT